MSIVGTDVVYEYRKNEPVIRGATFTIGRGEMVALVGPSGSGKTTLLQLIGRLVEPAEGEITGRPRAAATQWVFQVPSALSRRSVVDNVMLGAYTGRELAATRRMARDAVARVGLAGLADQRAGTLSGGELQRVQIARALVGEPELVLADEPTGQLDRQSTASVVSALAAVRAGESTVVVATHDPLVAGACDRQLVVRDGRVYEQAA